MTKPIPPRQLPPDDDSDLTDEEMTKLSSLLPEESAIALRRVARAARQARVAINNLRQRIQGLENDRDILVTQLEQVTQRVTALEQRP